jgi:hypothetical protein
MFMLPDCRFHGKDTVTVVKFSAQSMMFPRKQQALYGKFMQGVFLPKKIEFFWEIFIF